MAADHLLKKRQAHRARSLRSRSPRPSQGSAVEDARRAHKGDADGKAKNQSCDANGQVHVNPR